MVARERNQFRWSRLVIAVAFSICARSVCADNIQVDPTGANDGTLVNSLRFGIDAGATPSNSLECRPYVLANGSNKNQGANKYQVTPLSNLPPIVSAVGIASKRTPCGNQFGLDLYTGSQARLSITHFGQVGIGTTSPEDALDVRAYGDVQVGLWSNDDGGRKWTIQSSGKDVPSLAGTFQIIDRSAAPPGTVGYSRLTIDKEGAVSVSELKIVGGSDIAEPFHVSTGKIAKGSVVVIEDRHPGDVKLSNLPYDPRVAGIVSGAGGIKTGLSLRQGHEPSGANVALTGRVYALADASTSPIRTGDFLTTSAVPGHCMRAINSARARGAVLGKAMTPLSTGEGLVLVLITLQ